MSNVRIATLPTEHREVILLVGLERMAYEDVGNAQPTAGNGPVAHLARPGRPAPIDGQRQ